MRATIKDIAHKTGLSITTVSLVLNGKHSKFSQKTCELVIQTAKEMNYRPNQMAVSLLTKKSNTLGLVLPDVSNLFFSDFAKSMGEAASAAGYSLLLSNTDDEYEKERRNFRTMVDKGVDGCALMLSGESYVQKAEDVMEVLRQSGIPVVLADSFTETPDFTTVTLDCYDASGVVARHLLGLGHTRMACITGPLAIGTVYDRTEGFIDTLAAAGITQDPALLREGDFRYQSGYEHALSLIPLGPTALYCHNDLMAYGAMQALKEQGLRVPQDVSVVGFDDIFFSQYWEIPLTTIRQPSSLLGQKTAEVLIQEIEDPTRPKQSIIFESELVVRSSTGPVREGA